MSKQFFSSNDPDMPEINLTKHPKLSKKLPKLNDFFSTKIDCAETLFEINDDLFFENYKFIA